jgi:hypothetical protein
MTSRIFPRRRPQHLDGKAAITDAAMPLVVRVFKTAADPFVGRLTYVKVLSGRPAPTPTRTTQHNVAERLGASTCGAAKSK